MQHERKGLTAEEIESLIRQNDRLKSELTELREFVEAVMEYIPEAVTIVDGRNLTIRMVSKYGRELLGHPKKKFEGITHLEYCKIQDILNADGAPTDFEQLPLIRSTLQGETISNEEWVLKRSDGKKLNMLCNSGPVLDQHGNVIAGIIVWRDITEHKRLEQELRIRDIAARKDMERELDAKSYRLQEVNSALKALLRQRDEDRKELEESLLTNIENLILPYIKRLKNSTLSSSQASLLEILESHLNELTSKFGKTLALEYRILTPTEMRVAALVREGKTSKEIADLLCVSEKTASFHRNNIRAKLGLRGTGANLRSHLLSLV